MFQLFPGLWLYEVGNFALCGDFLLVQRMQPPQGPVQGLVPQVVLLVQSLEHTIRFAASISS